MLNHIVTKQLQKAVLTANTIAQGILAAGIFLISSTATAQTAVVKPGIFYAVTGNGLKDTSWLFGTYHLVKSSYLDKLPGVTAAFAKAKGVVVEVEADDKAGIQHAQAASLMQHHTLQGLLDKPFADSLDAELKTELGVGIQQMNQLKPIAAMLTLSMVYASKYNDSQLDKNTGLPLDIGFVTNGKKSGKPVTALETIASQTNLLLNRLTVEEQAAQLKIFLRNKGTAREEGNKLLQYWLEQDAAGMYTVTENTRHLYGLGDSDYFYQMNEARNNEWMKKLPGLMAQQSQFVAVGALHLLGPAGLPAQLRKLGFTVTPIKSN